MSDVPDDELDSLAYSRRDAARDEAARLDDQRPAVVHLGSSAGLATQLNAPDGDRELAVKLAGLSRFADSVNKATAALPRTCPHRHPIDDEDPCGKCEDEYRGIGEIS